MANLLREDVLANAHATLSTEYAAMPLLQYPLPGARGREKILVAHDSTFSDRHEALLMARQITVSALQARLAKSPLLAVTQSRSEALEKFVSGRLDHVYLDSANYLAYRKADGTVKKPDKFQPIYIDTAQQRLVIDLHKAFTSGDQFTAAAIDSLSRALRLPATALAEPQSAITMRRMLKTRPRTSETSRDTPSEHRPIRRRGALYLEYGYTGKEIKSSTKGADFYRPNQHPLIGDQQAWVELNRHSYTHMNHFAPEYTEHAPHKEIIVHRGLIDNRNGIPENSLAAIDNAYRHHYYSIEIDVQVTADDIPVLMHDFTAGRMTADIDNRLVSQLSSREITKRNLVIRNPATGDYVKTDQKVLTAKQALDHVVTHCPNMTIYLDCKESTPEATIAMLIEHPDLIPLSAVKLYGRTYLGGFPQLLSRLQERYNIDPVSVEHKPRRDELRNMLAQIKMVPILSQGFLDHHELRKYFGNARQVAQLNDKDAPRPSAEDMAEIGMNWLNSWDRNTTPVLLEVVQNDAKSEHGKAMQLIRERLREPSSNFANLPFSGSYRYEDFSVVQKDRSKKYYTWDVHGGIVDVSAIDVAAKRGTAGAFREEADSLLTDQPDEEVLALLHNQTLQRGHSGYELDLPLGTEIPLKRDMDNRRMRLQQFVNAKPGIDEAALRATQQGLLADQTGQ